MTVPKLSAEYRVRWRRAGWHPNECACVVVVGDETEARRAAAHIATMHDDVSEVVLEIRQVTRWRHHDIVMFPETPPARVGVDTDLAADDQADVVDDDQEPAELEPAPVAPTTISGDDEEMTTTTGPATAMDVATVQRAIESRLITPDEAPRFLAGRTLDEALAELHHEEPEDELVEQLDPDDVAGWVTIIDETAGTTSTTIGDTP
jgi:hypothetical protein